MTTTTTTTTTTTAAATCFVCFQKSLHKRKLYSFINIHDGI